MKWYLLLIPLLLVSCAGVANYAPFTPTASPSLTLEPTLTPTFSPEGCSPEALITPTMPAETPGYTELDPSTGLHMTGEYIPIDLAAYRLEVTGKVDHPLSLSYDDLRCMPYQEITATIKCQGYFEDRATWGGVPLSYILELAGLQEGVDSLEFKSADGFAPSVRLVDALDPMNLIVYKWEGEPLPLLHGFPVRAAFPGRAGSYWVKYLVEIVVE